MRAGIPVPAGEPTSEAGFEVNAGEAVPFVLSGFPSHEACAVFERLLGLRNDLGLLSEEYDPRNRRLIGNFPQAFSHVALVNTALRLRG